MSRLPAAWLGTVARVGWSARHTVPVIEVTVRVGAGGDTPHAQFGRELLCPLSPAKARRLADQLYEYAAKAEVAQSKELG
jgi:hypothetical protein